MKGNSFRLVVVLLAVAMACGCATIIKGSSADVLVESNPPGADVYIDDEYRGVTPLTVELDQRCGDYAIRMSKQGHDDATGEVTTGFSGWTIWPSFFIIDGLLGNALLGTICTVDRNRFALLLKGNATAGEPRTPGKDEGAGGNQGYAAMLGKNVRVVDASENVVDGLLKAATTTNLIVIKEGGEIAIIEKKSVLKLTVNTAKAEGGAPAPAATKTAVVADRSGISLEYGSESEGANSKTSTSGSAAVDAAGLTASYKSETLTARTGPVDSLYTFTYNANGQVGSGDNFSMYGLGAAGGLRYLDPSGNFPGDEGGSVHALDLRPKVGFTYLKSTFELPTFDVDNPTNMGTEEQEFGYSQVAITGMIGYTYMSLDPATSKSTSASADERASSGWGLDLGLELGMGLNLGESGPSGESSEFLIRPAFGLEFPTYNPGSGKYDFFQIGGFLWPSPFSAAIGLGGAFDL